MNNNNDLIILSILSIVTLLVLFRTRKANKLNKNINNIRLSKKKVRINPVPVAEYIMEPNEKFYEMKTSIKKSTDKKMLVLLCYANWCDQCKEFKKVFNELKQQQPFNAVQFDMVEEEERGKYMKYMKNVYGYPTVIIDNQGTQSQYTGPRDKISILNHIKNILNY